MTKQDTPVKLSWSSGVVSVKQCGLLCFKESVRVLSRIADRNLVTRGGTGSYLVPIHNLSPAR